MMTTTNVDSVYGKIPANVMNMMEYMSSISDFPRLFKVSVNVYNQIKDIPIVTLPYVFPPSAPFSKTTKLVYDALIDVRGKSVLDIGTGTGIQAICSALNGAGKVVASDISEEAIRCAKCNSILNGLEDKIDFYVSDMFQGLPDSRYDIMLCNLPILDMPCNIQKYGSLFDEGFVLHEELFSEGKNYLNKDGSILLTHTNFLGEDDFRKFEDMIHSYEFDFEVLNCVRDLGHEWRNYRLFDLNQR